MAEMAQGPLEGHASVSAAVVPQKAVLPQWVAGSKSCSLKWGLVVTLGGCVLCGFLDKIGSYLELLTCV